MGDLSSVLRQRQYTFGARVRDGRGLVFATGVFVVVVAGVAELPTAGEFSLSLGMSASRLVLGGGSLATGCRALLRVLRVDIAVALLAAWECCALAKIYLFAHATHRASGTGWPRSVRRATSS